jgi:hypothetical protein
MTKRMLLVNVASVCLALAALLGVALLYPAFRDVLKDFASIFLAIAAAYLTYCFQRRQAFLVSLRDLWHKCIEAKAELIEYTHDPKPDRAKFGKAHRALSTSMDLMRAAYCNVGETKTSIGLYPFEPLHDMRKALDSLGFENVTVDSQRQARQEIMNAWNAFRWKFLREFSTPSPTHHIVEHGVSDPRRRRDRSSDRT